MKRSGWETVNKIRRVRTAIRAKKETWERFSSGIVNKSLAVNEVVRSNQYRKKLLLTQFSSVLCAIRLSKSIPTAKG